jgi:hypothetical protein
LLVGVLVGLLAAVVLSGTGLAPAFAWAVLALPSAFGAGVDWCRPSGVRVVTLLSGIPVVAVVVTGAGGAVLVRALAVVWFVGVLAVLWSLERDGEASAAVARPAGPAPTPGANRLPDLVRVPVVALLIGVVVAVAAGTVPPPARGPSSLPDPPLVLPSDHGDPVLPMPAETDPVTTLPDFPDPPVTVAPAAALEPDPQAVADAGPLLLVVTALAALMAILSAVVRRARRPAPGSSARRWGAAAPVHRRPGDGPDRRRRSDPLGPPWAEDLRRRLEREGARRDRPRRPAESVTAYTEALAATALPDPRVRALGAALSTAYFGRAGPEGPASWSAVLDEICAAHPGPVGDAGMTGAPAT